MADVIGGRFLCFHLLQNYSCIHSLDGILGLSYFELEELRKLYVVATVEAFIVVVFSSILMYLTFRSLRNTNISQKTVELQRRFQKSLILQVTVSTMFFIFEFRLFDITPLTTTLSTPSGCDSCCCCYYPGLFHNVIGVLGRFSFSRLDGHTYSR